MFGLRGKDNPNFGLKRSEETRNKISESHKGKNLGKDNPMYDKKMSEESKAKRLATIARNKELKLLQAQQIQVS